MSNPDNKCVLCGSACELSRVEEGGRPVDIEVQEVKCLICGEYFYGPGYDDIKSIDEFQKNIHKLRGYFFEVSKYEHFQGLSSIAKSNKLSLESYQKILQSPLIPNDFDYQAKIKKFLRYLSFKTKAIGDKVDISNHGNPISLLPVFYAKTINEVSMYLKECKDNGFIDGEHIQILPNDMGQFTPSAPLGFSLTLEGLDYIREKDPESKDIFVAMAFNQEMYKIFNEKQFRNDIEKATGGHRLSIISEREHNRNIDDEIIAAIKQSKAMIADLTHGNQGAYYEAGYAHGKGMEVIFTCRKKEFDDEKKKPHFDINHRNFIVWEDAQDLKKRLIDRINATIR